MKNVPGTTNISFNKRDNVYTICKSINGKNKFFGEYPTLIIALKCDAVFMVLMEQ